MNDDSHGLYNINNQVRFKTIMIKSSLCDYSDAYILVKRTMIVQNTTTKVKDANNTNKKVTFKSCAPSIA